MKRAATPTISEAGEATLQQYARHLREVDDLHPNTIRGYLSDLRQFVAWWESSWGAGHDEAVAFTPTVLTTPTLTRYRAYLQATLQLRPATINRALITLKRYCTWLLTTDQLARNVATAVKLVPATATAPRHVTDTEEEALVAAVTQHGSLRDQPIIRLMLHTGLRAHEVCQLRRDHVTLGRRSGLLRVYGKRNKYREIPLNRTARHALEEYLPTCSEQAHYLFPSKKTGEALTPRALGSIIQKYAALARVPKLSPHDLRHRFGDRLAEVVPLPRLAHIMGHDSLDTTLRYLQATQRDLQNEGEKIAWS